MGQTDRGIVTVLRDADGTATVQLGTGVRRGLAVGVFARHVGVNADQLQIDVKLKKAGKLEYSEGIVEVYPDDTGTVHIRSIPDVTSL